MAKHIEWTEQQRCAWDEWVASRPACVQELCRRLPPDHLYRLRTSGSRCTIYSYNEDGTVSVNVTGEFNRVVFGRRVVGVSPDDLTECELPTADEDVGDTAAEAGYTHDDIEKILIPKLRDHWGDGN